MDSKQSFKIQWHGIGVEIRYCRTWSEAFERGYGRAMAHLEIEQPDRKPLPITETGYRSHFTPAGDIESAGGPVAYAEQWLDWAARDPAWKDAQAADRQLVLL